MVLLLIFITLYIHVQHMVLESFETYCEFCVFHLDFFVTAKV